MRNEWLASGGAYWILGGAWLLGNLFFIVSSLRHGAARGEEADGCILAIGAFVVLSVGGGIGLQVAPYPWSIVTAILLGLLFPSILTLVAHRRRRG